MTSRGVADFLYISKAKVDPLYQQYQLELPWLLRAIDQIGSITVLSSGVSRNRTEATLVRKLRRVQRFLDKKEEVGSVDEPKRYFFSRIEMHYGAFDQVDPPVMYLIGETSQTIVALGGQLGHVIGRDPETTKAGEDAKHVFMEPEVARAIRRSQLGDNPRLVTDAELAIQADQDQWAIDVAETLWHWSSGIPPMMFETLARCDEFVPPPAQIATRTQKNILVGSPIFVSRIRL